MVEKMAVIPQTSPSPEQRIGLSRAWLQICLCVVGAVTTLSYCYRTNFNSVIYRCDQYLCPTGLVCNSDNFCVNSPVEGCTNGGFGVDVNMFQCPGPRNACESNFRPCASPPPELACEAAGSLDMGSAAACVTCCRR